MKQRLLDGDTLADPEVVELNSILEHRNSAPVLADRYTGQYFQGQPGPACVWPWHTLFAVLADADKVSRWPHPDIKYNRGGSQ